MKRPAVFFDRDNTLIISDGYLGDPSRVKLIRGAADAIARARSLGYAVVVFSNQSGVARGMFSEEDVTAVNQRMDAMLQAENPQAVVDRHEFCPFHPDGTVDVYARESDRRKPKPGMILAAAKALALELDRSWVIGDAPRDIEAGHAAGCRTILFQDPSLAKSPAADAASTVQPDYTVTTLAEALEHIASDAAPASARPPRAAATTPAPAAVTAAAAEPVAVAAATPGPAQTALSDTTPGAASPPDAPPAKRVPKVAIGSKYVPKEGAPPPYQRDFPRNDEPTDRPTAPTRKFTPRAAPDPDLPPPPPAPSERMESLLEQIFIELRRQHEQGAADFSVSKLLAGIVQVIVLATLLLSYFHRGDGPETLHNYFLFALVLQTMTIALLIMSRQR
jgi:D,D-heptose 1,7-bisphosphate phosphatase